VARIIAWGARHDSVVRRVHVLRLLRMKAPEHPTLAHRELRNRSAEVLRRVQAGETFQVTNHGDVVAVLSPVHGVPGPRLRAASAQGGFASLPRVRVDVSTAALLDDLRGER
jgi:prevent-host-death family protein